MKRWSIADFIVEVMELSTAIRGGVTCLEDGFGLLSSFSLKKVLC